MRQAYRGQELTMVRGLFNQTWDIYLMDGSAILMIWLGLSDTWLWWSRNKKQTSHEA